MRFAFTCVLLTILAAPGIARDTIPAYLTTSAPELDGVVSPGEWDAAGPAIFVNQDSEGVGTDLDRIAEDPYNGDSDLSFQFRVMYEQPWTAYVLVEVFDDEAMDDDPANLWERDQIELFVDGDHQQGSDDFSTFQWWDNEEPFGKFGVSRYNTYEGNAGQLTDDVDNIFADDEFAFLAAAAVAGETGDAANYVVEYAINLEPMHLLGTFADDTITDEAGMLVVDHTTIKMQVALSDDDNFDTGDTSRSHTLAVKELSDWRASNEFPTLQFLGEFSGGTPGDYDGNGALEAADIDALSAAVRAGETDSIYDLDGSGAVNDDDRKFWISNLKNTWIGDSNFDGLFDSSDFVFVFTKGEYEDAIAGNSGWGSGDWNGDGDFDSSDFVAAFSNGGYDQGPVAATAAVPEPTSLSLLGLALLVGAAARKRS